MPFVSRNPYTEEVWKEYSATEPSRVDSLLSTLAESQRKWREVPFRERAEALSKVAKHLRQNLEGYSQLITAEMGKPIVQARAEIEKCAWACDYFAENAESMLRPVEVLTDARKSYVAFQPLGVVLAIMPWNFPFWQVFRFAVPALMAGNTVLLKPAPNTPACGLCIEEVFESTGLPFPLLRTVLVEVEQIPDLIRHPCVAGVTLTGSTRAGRAVAKVAGESLKKCVLELGGSDPALILREANLAVAVDHCLKGRYVNSGQSCIATKRILVEHPLYEDFVERFVEGSRQQVLGDPMDEATTIGPLARADLRENLHRQVRESVDAGAEVLIGGIVPEGRGYFYPPTVLVNIAPTMPVWQEETFGPVTPIMSVSSRYEAVQKANDSGYGLGASVFTENIHLGEEIARDRLEAGVCFLNHFVFSDPRLPFGGIKESGFGRELGLYGMLEFVNIKTVYIG